jgi:hypothetical protein
MENDLRVSSYTCEQRVRQARHAREADCSRKQLLRHRIAHVFPSRGCNGINMALLASQRHRGACYGLPHAPRSDNSPLPHLVAALRRGQRGSSVGLALARCFVPSLFC